MLFHLEITIRQFITLPDTSFWHPPLCNNTQQNVPCRHAQWHRYLKRIGHAHMHCCTSVYVQMNRLPCGACGVGVCKCICSFCPSLSCLRRHMSQINNEQSKMLTQIWELGMMIAAIVCAGKNHYRHSHYKQTSWFQSWFVIGSKIYRTYPFLVRTFPFFIL